MIGLDSIALTGSKELQTRITQNDGGGWKPLILPKFDSHGQAYDCRSAVRWLLV